MCEDTEIACTQVGLVLDLTNSSRYYHFEEEVPDWQRRGVMYVKVRFQTQTQLTLWSFFFPVYNWGRCCVCAYVQTGSAGALCTGRYDLRHKWCDELAALCTLICV